MIISQAVGRLVKLEFDTLVLGMSKWIWRTEKAPRIIEIVTRKPTMGIPALEHGLFVNLLIFDYLCMYVQVSAHVSV